MTEDFGAALLQPDGIANPYPIYRRLRDEAPVHWSPRLNHWVITKYDDVRNIYRDHERFKSEGSSGSIAKFNALPPDVQAQAPLVRIAELTPVLNTADRPAHTSQRNQVMRPLAPRRMLQRTDWLESLCEELADRLASAPEPDVIEDFAKYLSFRSILNLFGASAEIIPIYEAAAEGRIAMTSYAPVTVEMVLEYERALERFRDALEDVYARVTGDDGTIIGSLLHPEEGVTQLSSDEMFATLRTFFAAGHENLIYSIANTMVGLMQNREQYESVTDLTQAGKAFEEGLRWESTTQSSRRLAATDVELRGETIRAGQLVSIWRGSANRDDQIWTDADRFDIERDMNEGGGGITSFGGGIHFCAGAGLARLAGGLAVCALVTRFPSMRVPDGWTPQWRRSPSVRNLAQLPVVLA